MAHSRINNDANIGANVADFSYLKDEKVFTTYQDVGYPRLHDTEAKILEDIASKINDDSMSGAINLYTELPACQSCTNVIFEFKRKFPNIRLEVYSGE